MHKTPRFSLFTLLILAACLIASAQMNERRIFIWDISESLNSNGLFKPLQTSLITAIGSIPENPANDILLIPFYDEVLDQIKVSATYEGKSQLIDYIQSKKKAVPHGSRLTNIVDPIKAFHAGIDPKKRNYMFLYTDGENEVGNLGAELNQWNSKTAGKNCYGFYVLVHPAADKPEVRNAERTQSNFWVVPDANVRIKTLDLSPNLTFNSRNETTVDVPLSGNLSEISGSLSVKSCDPRYTVAIQKQDIAKGVLTLKITAQDGSAAPAGDCPCQFYLDNKDRYTYITPDRVGIKVLYKPERVLNVTIR